MKGVKLISTLLSIVLTSLLYIIFFMLIINLFDIDLEHSKSETTKLLFRFSLIPFLYFFIKIRKLLIKKIAKKNIKKATDITNNSRSVLVLRPFMFDENLDAYDTKVYDIIQLFGSKFYTIEEQISNAFKESGLEVISIADNKKEGSYFGFNRYKLDDLDWKDHVVKLIHQCEYICLIGSGNGEFKWEINTIKKLNYLKKILICYPSKTHFKINFYDNYNELGIIDLFQENDFKDDGKLIQGIVYFSNQSHKFEKFEFKYSSIVYQESLNVWGNFKSFLKNELALDDINLRPLTLKDYIKSRFIDLLFTMIASSILFYIPQTILTPIFGLFIAVFFLFLVFRTSPGNLILKISLKDKRGCPPQFNQKNINLLVLFLTSMTLIYYFFIPISIYKKKLYLMHCELSNTGFFINKKSYQAI